LVPEEEGEEDNVVVVVDLSSEGRGSW